MRFTGNYNSWEEAERDSTGYEAPEILEKTRSALLKVKAGEAAFERDSVTFDVMKYEFPLLAALLRAAAANGGQLSVLDFGGALGSSYFHSRNFLSILQSLRWNVVDQPAHVACGKADFANEQLRFYQTIDECLLGEKPNVLLLSSVLQYLREPYNFLDDILKRNWPHVVVDRTAFLYEGADILTVQHVPAWIYPASYPAWFLCEQRFRRCFEQKYELIATFRATDDLHPEGRKAEYKGFIFSLRQSEH